MAAEKGAIRNSTFLSRMKISAVIQGIINPMMIFSVKVHTPTLLLKNNMPRLLSNIRTRLIVNVGKTGTLSFKSRECRFL